MLAALEGQTDVVRVCVELGVDINAVMSGCEETVRVCIEELGGDVNAADARGFTCAMHAASSGYVDILRLLVRLGA